MQAQQSPWLRQIALVFLLFLAASATSLSQTSGENKAEFRVGVFDVDATPPIGSLLAYDTMVGAWDLGLRAKGIVLLGQGDPIVLCAVDWIGIANESHDLFREQLASAAGTSPDRVSVHSVHQHDAPRSDFGAEKLLHDANLPPGNFDGGFQRALLTRLSGAVEKAAKTSRKVTHVGFGKAEVHQVASNRRVLGPEGKVVHVRYSATKDPAAIAAPEGTIDPYVTLVSFWQEEAPIAVLSYYAVHPQSYYRTGIANPDFPGLARFLRQSSVPEALHIHFTGAAGNVTAGKYNDGTPSNRLALAQRLADGMQRAWEKTEKTALEDNSINWVTRPLRLEPNQAISAKLDKPQQTHAWLTENASKLAWYNRYKAEKYTLLSCLKINDIRILHMPAELFVEYQLAAQQMLPNRKVTMAAYADYGLGYIGTAASYSQGGYEVQVSPFDERAEGTILRAIREMLEQAEN
ncbi:putative protein-signal peptide and transmembrane prediction [Lunatimonas lonarensis]|uniref:Neutral/alkaline non-lysosomal ceramidase N-terminal domain-containing protein n=1 Tax=Lunatimonas lonarensis TaxID=1232681 RepID=R7ZSX7_9BACT|nr:protein-signal peptide [Lunatimonas lonarensis]EON77089.1 putative protein-signal peptide and transmembrane prediction [Lunatimonas lonarensis]